VAPHHNCKAEETRTEQRKRGRLRHHLSNDDLAVAGLEPGHEDLVRAGIERAAATTSRTTTRGLNAAPCSAAITTSAATTIAYAASSTPTKTTVAPRKKLVAEAGPTSQDWKWLTSQPPRRTAILARGKETPTATAAARTS
jgi:hypothetical protein